MLLEDDVQLCGGISMALQGHNMQIIKCHTVAHALQQLERRYDESMLSSLELRMAQYLSASTVSARNLNAEKEKIKELIADISHQTKTPISNILLYAQLLAEQPLPPESEPCVAALNTQAEKLSFLIESLVKVSRLESGVFLLSPSLQPVRPLLEQAIRQAAPTADAKGVALRLGPGDGSACFDRKWTRRPSTIWWITP